MKQVIRYFTFFLLLGLSACAGYRFSPCQTGCAVRTVSIPYVCGDTMGIFTDELIHALSASGRFIYQRDGGELTLLVRIAVNENAKIGYNYIQEGKHSKQVKQLTAVENRSTITAVVDLTDSCTNAPLIPQGTVTAYSDYDYADYNSIRDLALRDKNGKVKRDEHNNVESSIAFSLGQLDTEGGAESDVHALQYRKLARQIVNCLLAAEL